MVKNDGSGAADDGDDDFKRAIAASIEVAQQEEQRVTSPYLRLSSDDCNDGLQLRMHKVDVDIFAGLRPRALRKMSNNSNSIE